LTTSAESLIKPAINNQTTAVSLEIRRCRGCFCWLSKSAFVPIVKEMVDFPGLKRAATATVSHRFWKADDRDAVPKKRDDLAPAPTSIKYSIHPEKDILNLFKFKCKYISSLPRRYP
jgi:hypothetical protein